ncbi:FAD-binding oxidoreductase [Amylibacter sp.]|nr:FAD-binding oxidoreductase [Amylibacter sp.]
MMLSGWGRYPLIDAKLSAPRSEEDVRALVLQGNAIARGNGRAYGDSAVSAHNTIHMHHLNRMLSFDSEQGQLVSEAGVLLGDIIDAFLPHGWFPFVTPGTKFVTLGGMIAADVHGKNHHKDGSFATCVDWIDVLVSDGSVQRCSRSENAEFFEWTVGGMGLTGIVLRASIRLRRITSAWIEQRTLVAQNINQTIELFEKSQDATYSVAWIDCLQQGKSMGRSLVMLGEHADAGAVPSQYCESPLQIPLKRKLSIPVEFPSWALNNLTVRAFNQIYYWNGQRKQRQQLVDWDSYFYPLDAILGWNKIYGRHGFAQFQCVLPLKNADEGLRALLSAIANAGVGSFLAVLKRFGTQNSRFSFPMEGYTLALDFPVNKKTIALMERLDSITMEHGGRFYLAKDSRMSSDVFQQTEQRAKDYMLFRDSHSATNTFTSEQSRRLGL